MSELRHTLGFRSIAHHTHILDELDLGMINQ